MSQSCLIRWALYPPGRVPLGVTVHVNEEDGDVNVDTPSSLQVFKYGNGFFFLNFCDYPSIILSDILSTSP